MPNGSHAAPGVAAPTQKLVYNAQGQLAELRDVAGVLIATYVYRGDGKRAWKQLANGQRSYFYYAGETLIAATNGVDVSSLQLWGADGLIGARTTNATTQVTTKSYNLYDTQGNLAQTVNARNGNLLSKSAVNAWGEPIRDSAGNVAGAGYGAKFGYVRDGESGFYLCTLRYYDASGGRWLTRDPIGYAGGSNLYGYVGNDPGNATDPSGLARVEVHFREIEGAGEAIQSIIGGKKPLIYHAYIQVWEKGGKSSYIVRAGPGHDYTYFYNPLSDSCLGNLTAITRQWDDPGNPEKGGVQSPKVLVVASDSSKPASFYLDQMKQYVNAVNNAKIPYAPTHENSNAFVSNLLEFTSLLPNARNRAKPSVPGWGTKLHAWN